VIDVIVGGAVALTALVLARVLAARPAAERRRFALGLTGHERR
jgi:hypothetical protein